MFYENNKNGVQNNCKNSVKYNDDKSNQLQNKWLCYEYYYITLMRSVISSITYIVSKGDYSFLYQKY